MTRRGRPKGYKCSEATRLRISKSSIGKPGTYGHAGKPHSAESKAKMSVAKKGRPSWNAGLTKDADPRVGYERPTTFKLGHTQGSRFGRDRDFSGSNHYNWQGGKSKELYGAGWTDTLKESIRQRDEFTCQGCHRPQSEFQTRLSVHHINEIKSDLRPENLVTLCRSCHTSVHRGSLVVAFRAA